VEWEFWSHWSEAYEEKSQKCVPTLMASLLNITELYRELTAFLSNKQKEMSNYAANNMNTIITVSFYANDMFLKT
jgi:hypothetical protein